MIGQQLLPQVKVTPVKNAVAAGTGDTIQSDAVDMAGFEGVMFIVKFGAIVAGAVTTVKAQQSATAALAGTEDDLTGTAISVADDDDNQVAILDIYRPGDRYVNCAVVRATQNVTIESIVAVQYGANNVPVTQPSTVSGSETHISPAEGTA
jgi:hypothetical protein